MILRLCFISLALFISAGMRAQTVVSLQVNGTINPLTSAFIHDGIEKARAEKAECLVILLNTPGGLLKSTRVIVSDILASPVPVVVYVSPEGAHAGSAGVFIALAANVAAMAPGTNIGAAHPVNLDGKTDSVMNEKATNDASAFIRSIAQKRNRNIKWAEEAVRKSVSITATEALSQGVIDRIAVSERQLLQDIHGTTVKISSGNKVLNTKNARVLRIEMSTAQKLLDFISDPSVAYVLMLIGVYGILFELYSPGTIFPGVVGVISLILAFYALHTLPVNYAGLALIIFAIILFLLEIKVVSYGLLGIGGAISLVLGSLMLYKESSSLEFVRVSGSVIITVAIFTTLFFLVIVSFALQAQKLKPVTGAEGMIGEIGQTLSPLLPLGNVQVHGEIWNAEASSGKIGKGEKVRIVSIKNLKLFVEKISD